MVKKVLKCKVERQEYMTVGTFNAKVLSHDLLFVASENCKIVSRIVKLDSSIRISKKIISDFIANPVEGDEVYFRRSRYVSYNLKTVLTNRSGTITEITEYKYEGGKWANKGKVVKNGVY